MTPGTCGDALRDLLVHPRRLDRGPATSEAGIDTRSVSTSSGRVKPGSTCRIAWNVRIISPDATSSTTASAISTTTSVLRARWRARPALDSRPPSFSAPASCGVANLRTGISPKSSPASERDHDREGQHERIDA